MRKRVAFLCLLALCLATILIQAVQAEPLIYTGASGFMLTLPADWMILIGDDEDDDDYYDYDYNYDEPEPGDIEALFASSDGAMAVTVLWADETPVPSHAIDAVLSEPALELRVGAVNGYQKQFYRYDAADRRAYISYNLVDTEDATPQVEFLVGFITGSDIAQFLMITVRADQLDARFSLISEIVMSIDVGGVREGAEG
ncbi:MAG: hypothetical protein FWD25_02015 [Clostridia bacterium]|nr:hypothetical protein [Clostridia bacterium]